MAWYTHQILADYLNRIENHTLIGKVLDDILAEDVVLTYGTQTYSGKAAVLGFFEDTSHAISSLIRWFYNHSDCIYNSRCSSF